jgi:hypothetical protein
MEENNVQSQRLTPNTNVVYALKTSVRLKYCAEGGATLRRDPAPIVIACAAAPFKLLKVHILPSQQHPPYVPFWTPEN